jgi:hypothetical protein
VVVRASLLCFHCAHSGPLAADSNPLHAIKERAQELQLYGSEGGRECWPRHAEADGCAIHCLE